MIYFLSLQYPIACLISVLESTIYTMSTPISLKYDVSFLRVVDVLNSIEYLVGCAYYFWGTMINEG